MGIIFKGKDLKECLKKASSELSVPIDKIQYTMINESKKLFSKHCEIEVNKEEKILQEVEISEEETDIVEEAHIKTKEAIIEDNKIILKTDENKKFKVIYSKGIDIKVNDEPLKPEQEVSSKDVISYFVEDVKGKKELNIDATNMEAKITIKYFPSLVGKVTCEVKDDFLEINNKMIEQDDIPRYTKEDLKNKLSERGIVFGIDEKVLEELVKSKKEAKNVVVAKGEKAIDDENDYIKVLFQSEDNKDKEDSLEKIDYRNSNNILNVSIGEEIGELIVGKDGKDGTDIFGNNLSRKLKKNLQIKTGVGCTIKGNKVVSIIEGQPSVKTGVFSVHKVYKVDTDVDLKSGNINFVGDVIISKNIKEGMSVEVGNYLTVMGNIEHANIIAQGDTTISGSVINSQISIGSKDIMTQKKLTDLQELNKELEKLIEYTNELKERKKLGKVSDGEIIKTLIDSNCRNMIRKSMTILNYLGDDTLDEIKNFIRKRIIGLGSLSIKHSSELYVFKELIDSEIEPLSGNLYIPVDLHINYVQDSKIDVTGNVYIEGKGQYTSKISSFGDIIFAKSAAVSRGGELVAKGNIRAKVLGSSAGVSTILKVPKDKEITADIAYNNTTFFFGDKKYTLESPSKNVKAYLDGKGEIIVEKFVL